MSPKVVQMKSHPLPALFWRDDDEEPAPTREPIELVTVQRVARGGEDKETIDTCQPGSVPDTNALRERYGPGVYCVIGRSARGTIVARAVHTIGAPPGAPAPTHVAGAPAPHAATPAPAPASEGLSSLVALLIQQNNSLASALATNGSKSGEQLVTMIAEFSKARLVDQSDLFQTLLKAKGTAAGGGDAVAAYKDGMNKMLELLEAAKGDDDDDGSEDAEVKKINAVVRGLEAWQKIKQDDKAKTTPQ